MRKAYPIVLISMICLLAGHSVWADSIDAPPLPDEIKNLTDEQIVSPKKPIEVHFPVVARQANIVGDVWIRFTFSKGKAVSPKVVYCSNEGYQLEKAALMTFGDYDFSHLKYKEASEEKIFYTKVSFDEHPKAKLAFKKIRKLLQENREKHGNSENTDSSVVVNSLANSESDSLLLDIMPELIYRSVPAYPRPAKIASKSCTVYLRVLVSTKGYVEDVIIVKTGDPDWAWGFNESALESVLGCRFKPGMLDGKPVRVWVSLPYEFLLIH